VLMNRSTVARSFEGAAQTYAPAARSTAVARADRKGPVMPSS